MTANSRIEKTQYNFIYSLINNIMVTILGFVTRSIFVSSLGTTYLGLNGLFTNVLSLLSLAELGIGSAITFSLYKPIAENDSEKIKSLMGLYKKAYQMIGWIIFLLGCAVIPVLKYIVKFDSEIKINYYLIYFMFLINSVMSYWFFAYRSVIIYANQEGYITTKVETLFNILSSLLQFIVILLWKNYYLYLILPIILNVIKNIIISKIAGKKYPIINEKDILPLRKEERTGIFENVFALSLFRISGVVYGATDNIIISTWIGTSIVGIVSNYTMIIQLVTSYVSMFFQSMYASIGNLNASETREYKFVVFRRLQLLNFWIYCYCTICLGCFLNPCIKIWLGSQYCLQNSTVILLSMVFLVPGLNNVINIYKDACGLFKEVQFRALATAVLNLLVSVVLVNIIGLNGVFLGTIVAYLTTIYVVDPRVVFKKVFAERVSLYYWDLVKKMGLFILMFFVFFHLVAQINIENWIELFLVYFIVSILTNAILFLIYRRTKEFEYLISILKNTLQRVKKIYKN
ncbi:lipopolysaccharide biosynthesis protein [Murimonas intestini]|uniref:O-antigen/teichoic acid export membrane protein n=1 Tax=Murimonas intestini TaxID=1337051 RepID=A0AB73T6G5_9FIRM|nr:oligosaccharide flippase family protein [Murimonas intestini]MCR1839594.1 oligosaccharide flippase family protein [Murimonas intestini]MCR1866437.1 oligosaccharide flippase family protein [Murimonas intestini]MCR1882445.1 oligosaccharide flippase family protein [Murimonas intestini]